MKTLLVLSVIALATLQGCSKSEDSNQDANGACKQEYLDSWNAVARLTKYSSMSEATTACTNLKSKAGVSCKASVMVLSGSGQSGDRDISYNDHKTVCDAVLTTQSAPSTPSAPSNSYNPAPTSKYSKTSGGACNQAFLDLYNSLSTKSATLKLAQSYGLADKILAVSKELAPWCAEKAIASAQTDSCLATKNSSYSYYNSSVSVSLDEFDSSCALAQKMVDKDNEVALARSVRVLAKVETLEASSVKTVELKKFNSVGGATYLVDGKWLKQDQMKSKLATLSDDQTICNVTTTATSLDDASLKTEDVKLTKETVKLVDSEDTVELNKAVFKLTGLAGSVDVRCFKKSEITIDDIQTSLQNSIVLEATKAKK